MSNAKLSEILPTRSRRRARARAGPFTPHPSPALPQVPAPASPHCFIRRAASRPPLYTRDAAFQKLAQEVTRHCLLKKEEAIALEDSVSGFQKLAQFGAFKEKEAISLYVFCKAFCGQLKQGYGGGDGGKAVRGVGGGGPERKKVAGAKGQKPSKHKSDGGKKIAEEMATCLTPASAPAVSHSMPVDAEG